MLEMLHNLNLSRMFMTENITTEAFNIGFLISELPTDCPPLAGQPSMD
jgi:hypothetical protein